MTTESQSGSGPPRAAAGLDPERIRRAFAAASRTYDQADFLQSQVRDRLLERLDWVRLSPGRVLDLGAGTGRALDALATRYPGADLLAADLVPAMAATASRRRRQVMAVCCDAARLPLPDASVDLVFSNLLLHWCPLDAVLREARRVLRHPGLFSFATLGPRSYGELRDAWAEVDECPHVMDFPDLHAVGDALLRAGFAEPVVDVETLVVRYTGTRQLLADLRATGTGNAAAARARGLTGRGRWRRFEAACEARRDADGRFPLTLEMIFGQAWSPGAGRGRRATGDEVVIPLGEVGHRAGLRKEDGTGRDLGGPEGRG